MSEPERLLRKPRPHHYELGHVALRMLCDFDPLAFFGAMFSDNWRGAVDMLWERVCEQCGPAESTDVDIAVLEAIPLRVGDYPAVLVQMPPARAVAEAIYVLVVLTESEESLAPEQVPSFRYFVLERGMTLDGAGTTVLCEWSDDCHQNRGDGGEPDPEAFVARVRALL